MKRTLLRLGCALVVLCVAIAGAKVYFFNKGAAVTVTVQPGKSGAAVAQQLKKAGVIRSEWLFKFFLRLTSSASDLKAGTFDLQKNMSELEVINCIKSGRCTHYEKVTLLEGWRSEEIADELASRGITDGNEFLRIVRRENLEGYLFPSTYLFSYNMTARGALHDHFDNFNLNSPNTVIQDHNCIFH